jgi:HEAT repeat protein
MSRVEGRIRLGVIDSLGNRRAESAVSLLAELLLGPKEEEAIASAKALGKIASTAALSALSQAMSRSSGSIRDHIASSLLLCAEIQSAKGEKANVMDIYDGLAKAELPLQIRQAAMRGMITSSGDMARKMITSALKGKNEDWYAPAISMVKEYYDTSTIQEVLPVLPGLPAEHQIQLLQALSGFRDDGVRSAILTAVKNKDPMVRITALEALETAGNFTAVEFLASHAASSKGKEQLAARNSLWGLKCGRADPTILTNLVKNLDESFQHELILAVSERRIKQGLQIMASRAQYSSDRNRLQAIRGLKNIASSADLPMLVNLLLGMNRETEQLEMASTVAAVASKTKRPTGKAMVVMDKLESATDVKGRKVLCRTLGKIGDDSSLPLLREALVDEDPELKDAAVRALAEWPTVSAREDLLHIAQTSGVPVHKVLALQAYIRMMGMEPYRSPEGAVQSFTEILDLTRPEEKKLILGILPTFSCPDALELAKSLLLDKEIKAEAQMAIEKIEEKLRRD